MIPRCGARAYVHATVKAGITPDGLDLLYCAHHYGVHADGLFNIGAQIVDEREQLEAVKRLDVSA